MSSPMEPSYQQESPLTKALAQISAGKWEMYQKDFVPIENKFMQKTDEMNTPAQYELAGGLAQGEAMRQFQPELEKEKAQLTGSGAAPGSGAYFMGTAKTRLAGAEGTGQAGFLAAQGQQDRYRAGLETILGMGNGQSAVAQNSVTDLARQSVDAAKQQATMDWGEKTATVRGIGNIGGMLTNAGLNAVLK